MCDMTHSYVWHAWFVGDIYICIYMADIYICWTYKQHFNMFNTMLFQYVQHNVVSTQCCCSTQSICSTHCCSTQCCATQCVEHIATLCWTYLQHIKKADVRSSLMTHGVCTKVQVIFRKTATNSRALLRKTTSEAKASYGSSPPCTLSSTNDLNLECHFSILKSESTI